MIGPTTVIKKGRGHREKGAPVPANRAERDPEIEDTETRKPSEDPSELRS